jgi:hypothetical protein
LRPGVPGQPEQHNRTLSLKKKKKKLIETLKILESFQKSSFDHTNSVISAFRRLRQKDHNFMVSLVFTDRPCLKQNKERKANRTIQAKSHLRLNHAMSL